MRTLARIDALAIASIRTRSSAAMMRLLIVVAAAAGIFAATPRLALAAQVRIPLTIDYLTLREALKRELYTAPGGRAPLWNGSDDCQFLYAENPEFSREDASANVKLETAASLGLGLSVASQCLNGVNWSGIVEALGTPYIAPGLKLKFHFTDLNLYDSQHQKTTLLSQGFDLIKNYLIPQLDAFSYDLHPSIQQLSALIGDSATPEVADRIRAAIASLTAEPDIAALDDGIRVTLVMTVPDAPALPPVHSEATPSPAEIKAFETTLEQWDAFLVFAVKQLGDSVGDKQFRDQLLKILLDSRYRLVQALQHPPENSGPDPVRIIFLDEWRQLHDAVHSAAARGMLGARALEFLSFISAGDALFALDQAAPALGMRISERDLRTLAHIMAPNAAGDALKFDYREDRDLKKTFSIPEPPESRGPLDTSEDAPEDAPHAPLRSPTSPLAPEPHSSPGPSSFLQKNWLAIFSPLDAAASDSAIVIVPQLQDVAERLFRVVLTEDNAASYRRDMAVLLDLSAEYSLGNGEVDAANGATYVVLIKSTAWQESCWRQFVKVGAHVRWLESSTGDIGVMQVNKHIWRGFFSLERLEWDVLYNAGAGAEILAEMMRFTIAQPKDDPVPVAEHLARSAYAAYNAGPGAYDRWRRHEPAPLRLIDTQFLEKYQTIASGAQIDILLCARDPNHHPDPRPH
jgi:Transglycosylase SLT domain